MVSLARAVFDLVLPTEKEGVRSLLKAQREDTEFRKLCVNERLASSSLPSCQETKDGASIPASQFHWPIGAASSGILVHLPMMVTDIILENEQEDRRIIIDTKFTNILTRSQFGDGQRFKTGHIYQLYSYLRSQERSDDPRSLNSVPWKGTVPQRVRIPPGNCRSSR